MGSVKEPSINWKNDMKLYGYWRSTAAYRVRIAIALKQLTCEHISIHLVKDGGQQTTADYQALNPTKLVPTLVDGAVTLNQSLAIIEYLDEKYPAVPVLPQSIVERAQIRAFCQDIACDIHPLNNLRVLKYLKHSLGVSDPAKNDWYAHWIIEGFTAIETKLATSMGEFCFGDQVTMADICLIAQLYNAHRFNVPLQAFPRITAIEQRCKLLQAFQQATPDQQADAG